MKIFRVTLSFYFLNLLYKFSSLLVYWLWKIYKFNHIVERNMIKDEKRYNLADSICDKTLQSGAHGANHIVSTGHLSNLNSAQIRARADLGRGG